MEKAKIYFLRNFRHGKLHAGEVKDVRIFSFVLKRRLLSPTVIPQTVFKASREFLWKKLNPLQVVKENPSGTTGCQALWPGVRGNLLSEVAQVAVSRRRQP